MYSIMVEIPVDDAKQILEMIEDCTAVDVFESPYNEYDPAYVYSEISCQTNDLIPYLDNLPQTIVQAVHFAIKNDIRWIIITFL
jgi:hypothetical protein